MSENTHKQYPIPAKLKSAKYTPENYFRTLKEANENPDAFWGKEAKMLDWDQDFEVVKDTSFDAKDLRINWFKGGKLNVAKNCLDRHLKTKSDKPAIIWEADDPNTPNRILTYRELHREVCIAANMLTKLGVKEGDTVTVYMPMIPEAAIAMLAVARIGAIHSVVFGGFSPESLKNRLDDCHSKLVITADQGNRGSKKIAIKANVEEAIKGTTVEKILVVKHTGGYENHVAGRDFWWHELRNEVSDKHEAKSFDSEQPLFILYTSGSTGKPKGILHTSAGYLLYATHTFQNVFDYKEGEIFWCTADIGWVTGHSYIVYGPLAAGATTLMFEGVPTYPDASRCWQIVDKYKVSLFYTAPTAIRMLMKEGDNFLDSTSRNSLRVIGSVGEPINPEAWEWYYHKVGKAHAAVVDTWWQTETGGHLLTGLPGAVEQKPGSASYPYFSIKPIILDVNGKEVAANESGALCIKDSWPGQARSIWGDHKRFIETYFTSFPGYYFSGDAAQKDSDGYYWIEGRMDDVINVSGHRIGTAEIEAVIDEHPEIVEAAVVGFPHDLKGQGIYAYIILHNNAKANAELMKELNLLLRKEIGPIASLDKIHITAGLPKTRSGKIMRRILRKIAAGEVANLSEMSKLGDISTLLNPEIVEELILGNKISV